MKDIIVALVFVLVSGCSANGQQFVSPEIFSSEQATVYVYRVSSFVGYISSLDIDVDGKKLGSVKNAGYIRLPLDPGTHEISRTKAFLEMKRVPKLELTAQPGKVYYVKYVASVGGVWYTGANAGATMNEEFFLVPDEVARSELVELKSSM